MRVLIVEDEPNLGRQLRATLEGAGYAIDLAQGADRSCAAGVISRILIGAPPVTGRRGHRTIDVAAVGAPALPVLAGTGGSGRRHAGQQQDKAGKSCFHTRHDAVA